MNNFKKYQFKKGLLFSHENPRSLLIDIPTYHRISTFFLIPVWEFDNICTVSQEGSTKERVQEEDITYLKCNNVIFKTNLINDPNNNMMAEFNTYHVDEI